MGRGMNERPTDFNLLQRFARQGDQEAFATVVRRHVDLVYATALRKIGDGGGAEEVAQNVYVALARKAWQFAPGDSLPAWLYRATLLEAKEWLRGELRRRRREQTAVELGTAMNSSHEQSSFRALIPMLDEALLSLRSADRAALLLRYYEHQTLRELGASLGISEDAAQKRVATALDRVARFFQRHGYRTGTVAAAAAALEHTAAAAPSWVSATVLRAAVSDRQAGAPKNPGGPIDCSDPHPEGGCRSPPAGDSLPVALVCDPRAAARVAHETDQRLYSRSARTRIPGADREQSRGAARTPGGPCAARKGGNPIAKGIHRPLERSDWIARLQSGLAADRTSCAGSVRRSHRSNPPHFDKRRSF